MKLIIELTDSELANLEEITKSSFYGIDIDADVSDAISKLIKLQPCEDCFTDDEKRIFLASVAREMRVCEVIDSEKTKVKLVPILERVKDKVLRSSLWKEVSK